MLVLEYQVEISPCDRWGGTPLDDAMRSGFEDVADFLTAQGAVRGAASEAKQAAANSHLVEAAASGQLERMRQAIQEGAQPAQGDYDFRTVRVHLRPKGQLET